MSEDMKFEVSVKERSGVKQGSEKKGKRNPVTQHPSIVGGLGIAFTGWLVQQGVDPEQASNWSTVLLEVLVYLGVGGLGSGFIWGLVSPVNKKD